MYNGISTKFFLKKNRLTKLVAFSLHCETADTGIVQKWAYPIDSTWYSVPLYLPAFAAIQCTSPQKAGQVELTWYLVDNQPCWMHILECQMQAWDNLSASVQTVSSLITFHLKTFSNTVQALSTTKRTQLCFNHLNNTSQGFPRSYFQKFQDF